MYYYAGIDVSLECSSVCVVDGTGKILREAKVASEPEALIAWFGSLGPELERIGLEAGPLSQWLYAALREAGFAVELLETRHVRDAFKAMPVKSDRNDARGIAQLMRLGWFRPVHCKSMEAQEMRAVLTARKLLQSKLRDIENSLRGDAAGLRPEGRQDHRMHVRRAHPGAGCRSSRAGSGGKGTARSPCGAAARVQWPGQAHAEAGPGAPTGQAFDDNAGRWSDRGSHLCLCDRRSKAVQIIEGDRCAFRPHAEEIPVGANRLHRPHQQDRRCFRARGALPGRSRHADQAGQKLLGAQELGDADRQACGHAQGKVALARKLAVILHRMLADAKPFNPTAKAAAT